MKAQKMIKSLGLIDVFCISSGAMISSGIFILPGMAFDQIGPAVFIAYALGGIFSLIGTMATIELATAMPLAGGIYYYTERSLGPLAGTISGVLNWSAIALKSSFAIFGMAEVAYQFFGWDRIWSGVLMTILFVLVNLIGTKAAAWAQLVMVFFLLLILGLYIVLGFNKFDIAHFQPLFKNGTDAMQIIPMAAFIFVAYGGLLDVASISEEVKNPRRNLPLGMLSAVISISIIYVLIVIVTVGVLDGKVLAQSLTPLADAARVYYGNYGVLILTFAALMAFVTTANAGVMAAARFPLALSRDKLIPRFFSKVYGSKQLPLPAIIITGIVMGGAQFLDLNSLVEVASTVIMLSFVLTNIAVIILRESQIQNYQPSFKMPWYPILPVLSIGIFIYMIVLMGLGAVRLSLGIVGFALVMYFIFGRKTDLEFALMHLIGRIFKLKSVGSHKLESELREIVRNRDDITHDEFDVHFENSSILILDEPYTLEDMFVLAAENCKLPDDDGSLKETIAAKLLERENQSSTLIAPGIAIPHVMISGKNIFKIVIIKSKTGIVFDSEQAPAKIILLLINSNDQRNLHLRFLAAFAQIIQGKNFEKNWEMAQTIEQIRDLFLLGKRKRYKK